MATTSDGRLITAANPVSYGLSVSASNETEYSCHFGMFSPIVGLSSLQILRYQDCEVCGSGGARCTPGPPLKKTGGAMAPLAPPVPTPMPSGHQNIEKGKNRGVDYDVPSAIVQTDLPLTQWKTMGWR